MAITYSLELDAPIEKAFHLVDDEEMLKLWMEGLEETTYPEGHDRERPVGTKFRQKIREGGRVVEYDGEVTAYEKPEHLGVKIGNKHFQMQADYRFTRTASGTRLDYSCELVDPSWFARLMMFLFGWLTRRILRKQMTAFKRLAEAN